MVLVRVCFVPQAMMLTTVAVLQYYILVENLHCCMYVCLQCSVSSPEEEKLITVKRPKTPVSNELSDINTQTNWTKSLPLPTPEEKMRQQAQAVQTDVVPINVTGRLLFSIIKLQ